MLDSVDSLQGPEADVPHSPDPGGHVALQHQPLVDHLLDMGVILHVQLEADPAALPPPAALAWPHPEADLVTASSLRPAVTRALLSSPDQTARLHVEHARERVQRLGRDLKDDLF